MQIRTNLHYGRTPDPDPGGKIAENLPKKIQKIEKNVL